MHWGVKMPLYVYFCTNCDNEIEVLKSLKDLDREEHCEQCGEPMSRSCGNNGGFRLEGGCWAHDGYSTLLGDAHNFKAKG